MKKKLLLAISILSIVFFTGCGGNETNGGSASEKLLSAEEIQQMYSDPDSYKGAMVELTGRVFSDPEYDSKGIYFQMWGDPEQASRNTYVFLPDSQMELKSDDYVKVKGKVKGAFEGTNMMGGKVVAAGIIADSVERSSYKDVIAPTVKTATPKVGTIEQLGYEITVNTVELAQKETRAYITVKNNGHANLSVYVFNMILVQNNQQYSSISNFEAGYPEIQTDLRPGVVSEGVAVFPAIDMNAPFQIIMEAHSDNWDEQLDEYIFEISVDNN